MLHYYSSSPSIHSSQLVYFLPHKQTLSPVRDTCSVVKGDEESDEADCLAFSCERSRVAERMPEVRELWEDQETARENWSGEEARHT